MFDARPVAVVERSGFDESVHHGLVVALDESGAVALAVGDVDAPIYPRSANKPIQADAMVGAGWQPSFEQLALACASHDGTHRHIAVARSTLRDAGLDEGALDNTPDMPLNRAAADELVADGVGAAPVFQNCSGKHAAMVATCVVNEWPVDGYREVDHPLQLLITERVTELAGGVTHIGVDGCGAPAHAMSLRGLATAFRILAVQRSMTWTAMTTYPDLVGGHRRDVTELMRNVPDLMAKDGAEGVFAAALPDGRAAAVKIADGNKRAAGIVIAAALAAVGVDVDPGAYGEPVRGHGRPVGRVRPLIGR